MRPLTFWERAVDIFWADWRVLLFAAFFFIVALTALASLVSCSTHQPPGAGLDVGLCATVVCHPA